MVDNPPYVINMELRKRMLVLLVALVALSTVAATQFATSDIGYEYGVVSASDSNIRFIGHDYGADGTLVLRADTTAGDGLTLDLGDVARGQKVWYTAAFGIVNEEALAMNVTAVTVSSTGGNYMQIYLHNNANTKAESDSGTLIWDKLNGAQSFTWALAAGDNDATTIDGASGDTTTSVDSTANIRAIDGDPDADDNAASDDHVWVQIIIDIPESATNAQLSGTITFDFSV